MKIDYLPRALKALEEEVPAEVRKAFFKQVNFLKQNLQHPYLASQEVQGSWRCMAGAYQP